MAIRARNVLLIAKLETVPGTDAAPTPILNAMHARVTSVQPTQTEFAERGNVRAHFGSGGQVQVSNHSVMDVEVELSGSGTAGTAPAYAPLLRACGMEETISAGASAAYTPITDAPETATFYFYLDGLRHTMTGARGTFTLDITSRAIPMIRFHFLGLYTAVKDEIMPATADYSAWKFPLAVNRINTPAWAIHGASGVLQSLSVDLGNTVTYRNLVGHEGVSITDRRVSGQASFEMVSVATKPWHEAIRTGELGALTLTHGTDAGNTVEVSGPSVQVVNPQYAEQDGIQMLNVGLDFQPVAGDDEIALTVK